MTSNCCAAIMTAAPRRHSGNWSTGTLVHSVALRQVRNPDWADEVARAVFIALARKAGSISEATVLAGWLYRSFQRLFRSR